MHYNKYYLDISYTFPQTAKGQGQHPCHCWVIVNTFLGCGLHERRHQAIRAQIRKLAHVVLTSFGIDDLILIASTTVKLAHKISQKWQAPSEWWVSRNSYELDHVVHPHFQSDYWADCPWLTVTQFSASDILDDKPTTVDPQGSSLDHPDTWLQHS